jgi:glycosyltransferase involved in cell wall biosynthesis
LCKLLNRLVVWTVHNVGAYENNYPKLERLLWRVFLPRVNWAIHLCPASLEATQRLTSRPPPASVIPHPHYRFVYEACDGISQTGRPQQIQRRPFVISSLGLIRPYKGFENLARVFHSWRSGDVLLRIAGEPSFKESERVARELVRLSADDPRITLQLRALSKSEVRDLICTSDLIVLPYGKMMNSGVAALALSLGRPILGPAAGCILDYHDKLGSEWVLMFDRELTVQDLTRAYDRFSGRNRLAGSNLKWMDPDRIANDTIKCYRQVTRTDADQATVAGPIVAEPGGQVGWENSGR